MRRLSQCAAAFAIALPLAASLLAGPAGAEEQGYGAGGASVGSPGVSSSVGGPGAEQDSRQMPYSDPGRPSAEAQRKIDARIDDALDFSRRLRERVQREEEGLTPAEER